MWWLIFRGGGGTRGRVLASSQATGEAAVTAFPLFYATALLATARTIATAARHFIALSQRTYKQSDGLSVLSHNSTGEGGRCRSFTYVATCVHVRSYVRTCTRTLSTRRTYVRTYIRSLVPRLLPPSLKLLREEPGNGATYVRRRRERVDRRCIYICTYVRSIDRSIDRRARAGRTAVRASRNRV